jgi:hypothetical protein
MQRFGNSIGTLAELQFGISSHGRFRRGSAHGVC